MQFMVYFLAKHSAVLFISLVEIFFMNALSQVVYLYFLNYFF